LKTTGCDNPDRRDFLGGVLIAGAASVAPAIASAEQGQPIPERAAPAISSRLRMAENQPPADAVPASTTGPELHVRHPGSDFMVEIFKALGVEYVAAMPGSTFRGLHESIVNFGGNQAPEIIVCSHEEASTAIAHGYAKVAGKPMVSLVHSNVGLQHASMAIYNAWCDRVPLIVIAGNILDATQRRPGVEWYHTAQDLGSMVRDFVKWDDTPVSLQHFAESFVRAYSIAMTPPMEPVLIVADADLQEEPVVDRTKLKIPALARVSPPSGDSGSVAEAARLLAGAANPLIVADRAVRTAEGLPLMVQLAELLNAPVVDQLCRMNFPTTHYLNQTWLQRKLVAEADVILCLELSDVYGLTHSMADVIGRQTRSLSKANAKVISISSGYGYLKSNQQDFERYFAADVTMAADAQATLPALIREIERLTTPSMRSAIAARTERLQGQYRGMREAAVQEAALAWDASPVSTARLSQELWAQIKPEPWALVSNSVFVSRWPQRLWDFTEYYQYMGAEGGYGVGYGFPAAAGAALAHAKAGRLSVNIQSDGDFMVLPGVLWTLAHHSIPLLSVMHNNRAWHQETMHVQRMACRRDRNPERAPIGTVLSDPDIDYAAMARSMGVWAEGPILDPGRLGPAIARALKVVKSGKPALLDVVTQPR
jgi:acetolactate synthase I/II/III large subunit